MAACCVARAAFRRDGRVTRKVACITHVAGMLACKVAAIVTETGGRRRGKETRCA